MALLNARFSEHLGFVPLGFAYPFGIRCPSCKNLLLSSGCRALFTCDERVNYITQEPGSLYELGRFNRPEDANRYEFFLRMGIG